jgi:hypothetical protein
MLRSFSASPSSRVRRTRRARRLGCGALEVRQLLSNFTVNEVHRRHRDNNGQSALGDHPGDHGTGE